MRIALTALMLTLATPVAANGKTVFKCGFEQLAFYITIDNADKTARLGKSIDIGNFCRLISIAYTTVKEDKKL